MIADCHSHCQHQLIVLCTNALIFLLMIDIILQLPDCLPGLRPSVEPEGKEIINGTSASPSALVTSGESSSASQVIQSFPCIPCIWCLPLLLCLILTNFFQCTLSNLSEGNIGKIQLLRSGRAFLKLGSVSLPISMGTQVGFRQVNIYSLNHGLFLIACLCILFNY